MMAGVIFISTWLGLPWFGLHWNALYWGLLNNDKHVKLVSSRPILGLASASAGTELSKDI